MLKIPYQKLRLSSKGNLNLNANTNNGNSNTISRISRRVLQGIPVLSIFALVGISLSCLGVLSLGVVGIGGANGTALAASTVDPSRPISASLTIMDPDNTKTVAGRGNTAYFSHNVKVTASNISDYALTISGPENMAGPSPITGTNVVVAGDNLAEDHWGYAWLDNNTTESNYRTALFSKLAGINTPITLAKEVIMNNAVDYTKKIVFAAKFSEDAEQGNYTADITLSLTANPIYITIGIWNKADGTTEDSGITTMQGMTPEICANATIGDSMLLQDSRDGNVYSIAKLVDEKCWMTENLRLTNEGLTANGHSAVITAADSDVSSNFTIPASSTSGFSAFDTANVYYGGDTVYGAYYTWYAATAGTGTQSVSSGDAPSSICSKGWKLPNGGSSGDFQTLNSKYSGAWTTNGGKNGRWLGAASTAAGGAFFPAAGRYSNSSVGYVDINGYCWARTAGNSNLAYNLFFNNSDVLPANYANKYYGYSVRCVADKPLPTINYTINFEGNNSYYNKGTAPDPIICSGNSISCTITLPTQTPTAWCGRNFRGWSTNKNASSPSYAAGSSITVNADTTLYGVWTSSNISCGG